MDKPRFSSASCDGHPDSDGASTTCHRRKPKHEIFYFHVSIYQKLLISPWRAIHALQKEYVWSTFIVPNLNFIVQHGKAPIQCFRKFLPRAFSAVQKSPKRKNSKNTSSFSFTSILSHIVLHLPPVLYGISEDQC